MALTFKITKHLIRVHNQGSTDQTRFQTYRFGSDLRTEPDCQTIETSDRTRTIRNLKLRTGSDQYQEKFPNLGPDRIRANKILKISD